MIKKQTAPETRNPKEESETMKTQMTTRELNGMIKDADRRGRDVYVDGIVPYGIRVRKFESRAGNNGRVVVAVSMTGKRYELATLAGVNVR